MVRSVVVEPAHGFTKSRNECGTVFKFNRFALRQTGPQDLATSLAPHPNFDDAKGSRFVRSATALSNIEIGAMGCVGVVRGICNHEMTMVVGALTFAIPRNFKFQCRPKAID